MPRKKPKDAYHHPDLRRALIDGALQLIARDGASALTLREVARRAGVSHTAPYRHFADKESLLAAVAEEGFVGMGTLMDELTRDLRDPTKALEAYGVAYVRYALRHPAHFVVMFSHQIQKGSGKFPSLDVAANLAFAKIVQTAERGQAKGKFRGTDPLPIAIAAWSLVHGLSNLLVESLLPQSDDVEAMVRDVIDVAIRGVLRVASK